MTFIKETFGYPEEDVKVCLFIFQKRLSFHMNYDPIKEWLQGVQYTSDCRKIEYEVISRTLSLVQSPWSVVGADHLEMARILQESGAVTLQEGGSLLPNQFVNEDVIRTKAD